MQSFEEIGLSKELLKSIGEIGFKSPTPIQKKSIPFLLRKNKDLIALAQTGTGKTAAFGLPILQQIDNHVKNVQTIVLCPTRELCIQISNDLEQYSKYLDLVKILPVYGGTSIENQIKSIKKGVQVVVGTPGRTKDLINRKILKLNIVNRVVLDEADEMLSMGFKDDLDYILDKTSTKRQTLLFSATMSKEVIKISKKYMKGAEEIAVSKINSGAKNVKHHIYNSTSSIKYETLKRIVDFNPNIYGIVFCRTRRETKDIVKKFINDGYNTDAIHGDLSQSQRDQVMLRFKDKSLQILVATDVAARGLDVEDLTHVINYSLPDDPEVYTHRSGRTGRAGKNGISIAIINNRDLRKVKLIEKTSQIKFLYKEVPNGKDICSNQLMELIDKIEKVKVDEKQIEPYLNDIYKKLEGLNREDLIKHFISNEFNRFLDYYKNREDINHLTRKNKSIQKEKNTKKIKLINFSINVGRKNGFSPIELISLISSVLKSKKIKIGSIDIRESYSIFEIDSKIKNDLKKNFNKINYNDLKLTVTETSEEIQKKHNNKNKRSFVFNKKRNPRSKDRSRKSRKNKKRRH
tara:strand:- start:2247 stop:3974 length:1728 start_codon:yes stop_codon:yes gene_type:complete